MMIELLLDIFLILPLFPVAYHAIRAEQTGKNEDIKAIKHLLWAIAWLLTMVVQAYV